MTNHGPSRRSVLASAAALAAGLTLTASPAHALATARSEVALPDGIQPEGITSAPGGTFFVGSLADGRIVTGDVLRGTTRVLLPGAPGRRLTGLFHDDRTGLVWAAGAQGTVGHVWAVDSRSGAVRADYPVPGSVFLNDLVVRGDTVWVTDSQVDRLTSIGLRRGLPVRGPQFVPLRGEWPAFDGSALNANGIRTLPGGHRLVLNNSRVGGLWGVNPETGWTREIPVTGTPSIVSGDGLERRGNTLWVVRGDGTSSVTQVALEHGADGWTGKVTARLSRDRLDVPSTATLAAGALYAVNARFGTPSPTTARYWVTRLETA